MSKSNRAASRITLGSTMLDGYTGDVDVVRMHRSWWRKLLRLRPVARSERRFVDVKGDRARAWRR